MLNKYFGCFLETAGLDGGLLTSSTKGGRHDAFDALLDLGSPGLELSLRGDMNRKL